jgi:hypothetical protein
MPLTNDIKTKDSEEANIVPNCETTLRNTEKQKKGKNLLNDNEVAKKRRSNF